MYCHRCEQDTNFTTLRKDGEITKSHCSNCGLYEWRNDELEIINTCYGGFELLYLKDKGFI